MAAWQRGQKLGTKRGTASSSRNRLSIFERIRSGDVRLETITSTDYSHIKTMISMRKGLRREVHRLWWEMYAIYCLFASSRGHGNVQDNRLNNAKYPGLAHWIVQQRSKVNGDYNTSTRTRPLTQEEFGALEDAGMIWNLSKHEWERDLILFDRYFEEYPEGHTCSGKMSDYITKGTLDDGFESDGQRVWLGNRIACLRRAIEFQCDQIPKYSDLRNEPDGKKRNKHLGTTFDLCESQINDLIRVNFTMGRATGFQSLHAYLEGKNVDYQHTV